MTALLAHLGATGRRARWREIYRAKGGNSNYGPAARIFSRKSLCESCDFHRSRYTLLRAEGATEGTREDGVSALNLLANLRDATLGMIATMEWWQSIGLDGLVSDSQGASFDIPTATFGFGEGREEGRTPSLRAFRGVERRGELLAVHGQSKGFEPTEV